MPYIKPKDRTSHITSEHKVSRQDIGIAFAAACRNGGDIQYILAVALNEYMKQRNFRYEILESVMGALKGAEREFYTRVVKPYEDLKIVENGGVYDCLPK